MNTAIPTETKYCVYTDTLALNICLRLELNWSELNTLLMMLEDKLI